MMVLPPKSTTARSMAAFRALETAKPAAERLFDDPYARRFLSRRERLLLAGSRLGPFRHALEACIDVMAPGARTSGIARTRLIDDWLREEVSRGARQLVTLGAGLDCRALRLPEFAGLTCFELDRATMIAWKNEKLRDKSAPPENLKRLAVDFQKDDMKTRLLGAGYSVTQRSIFVWEGVTHYLDARAVKGVFDFVARYAPAASRIIFSYVHRDAISGGFEAPGLRSLLAKLERRGEPWVFGFDPAELTGYLASRGLSLLADLGAAEYRRRYFRDMPARGVGYEFYRVARAEVATHAAG